jgi:ATP-dependent protease ClpP protease subunit
MRRNIFKKETYAATSRSFRFFAKKEMKKETGTIQKLVLMIDREFPKYSDDADAWNYFINKSLYYYIDDKPYEIDILALSRCLILAMPDLPEMIIRNTEEMIDDKTLNFFRNILLPNISSMELNILINSPGGSNSSNRLVINLLRFFNDYGGTINAFSFIETCSAASYVFTYSDKRYCLNFSRFLCHYGIFNNKEKVKIYKSKKKILEQEKKALEEAKDLKDDYKEHLDKFFKKRSKKFSKVINRTKKEALGSKYSDLIMQGTMLETWGIVDKAYLHYNEYIDFMDSVIGREIVKHDIIQTFCKRMEKYYNFVLKNPKLIKEDYPRFRLNKIMMPEEKFKYVIYGGLIR